MPRYAVLQSHPPDNCPMTNQAVRAFALEHLSKMDETLTPGAELIQKTAEMPTIY